MPHSNCTHACEARGAVLARGAVARGAVARGAVARGAVRGVPWRGSAAGHRTSKWTFSGCQSCSVVVRMLWSSISALKRA